MPVEKVTLKVNRVKRQQETIKNATVTIVIVNRIEGTEGRGGEALYCCVVRQGSDCVMRWT